jgi:hypothetical protein
MENWFSQAGLEWQAKKLRFFSGASKEQRKLRVGKGRG